MQSIKTIIFILLFLPTISLGATFGHTPDSTGAGSNTADAHNIIYALNVPADTSGTLTHISFLMLQSGSFDSIRFIMYLRSDSSAIDSTSSFLFNIGDGATALRRWVTLPVIQNANITEGTRYMITAHGYNSGGTQNVYRLTTGASDSLHYGANTWDGQVPDPPNITLRWNDRELWCYATYTPTESQQETKFFSNTTDIVDTWIGNQSDTNVNKETDTTLRVENNGLSSKEERAIIQLNTSIWDSIGAGQIITSCSLIIITSSGIFSNAVRIAPIKRNILITSLDWNEFNASDDWETPGAKGANDVDTDMDTTSVTGSKNEFAFEIDTSVANAYYNADDSLPLLCYGPSTNLASDWYGVRAAHILNRLKLKVVFQPVVSEDVIPDFRRDVDVIGFRRNVDVMGVRREP